MMRMSRMPARTASSTTYWMAGLSTRGSISLGWALVAGRKRVPRPAAGMTALATMLVTAPVLSQTTSLAAPRPQRSLAASGQAAQVGGVADQHQRADQCEAGDLGCVPAQHGREQGR